MTNSSWWINKYILRKEKAPLTPLYHFESSVRKRKRSSADKGQVERGEHREHKDETELNDLNGMEPVLLPYSGGPRLNF